MISLKSSGEMSRLTCGLMFVLVSSAVAGSTTASAQTLTTLATLNDGQFPWGNVVIDASGSLLGTTEEGGASGYGTVFEIANSSSGYAGTSITLASFEETDGAFPLAGLIADANGNLFGTTEKGGASGYGTVFEIARNSTGYSSTAITLVSFKGNDGAGPFAGLIADANGNLFGTTEQGGTAGYGTVFEIANSSNGYASTPITLVSFNGNDGAGPDGGLVADANGNLFGTTEGGGASGHGTVFEIAKTSTGYASTPTTLVNFDLTNGGYPLTGLIVDANGNLFGTAQAGGTSGYGTVFEIINTSAGYASTPTTLVNFNFSNGAFPLAGLIADANGNLFGTTYLGGAYREGTVFEVAKRSSGYATAPTILVNFDNNNGAAPFAGLTADANGNLFGTTSGGSSTIPTVFEITGSGFAVANHSGGGGFAGTPGNADCIGKSVSALAQTYGGTAHAAPALGYNSVSALQSAIHIYCSN